LDIHPHAGAIRSIRDYLVHLSMVVLGILIALGLEQWREASHNHAIAQRALDDMLVEIRENRTEVVGAALELKEQLPDLQAHRDLQLKAIEAGRTHSKPPPEARPASHTFHTPTLSTAAWDNALAMQALGRIDFETARKLARVYSEQREVKDAQRSFIAVATHLDAMAGRALNDTPERMIERYGRLEEVGISMINLDAAYGQLLKAYDQAATPTGSAADRVR